MAQGSTITGLAATRAHAVSKLFAFALLALILLPFTAPFPTCELTVPASSHGVDAVAKDKTVDDAMPASAWSVAPLDRLVAAAPHVHRPTVDFLPLTRTNLRL